VAKDARFKPYQVPWLMQQQQQQWFLQQQMQQYVK
jgi:hypothetical protein